MRRWPCYRWKTLLTWPLLFGSVENSSWCVFKRRRRPVVATIWLTWTLGKQPGADWDWWPPLSKMLVAAQRNWWQSVCVFLRQHDDVEFGYCTIMKGKTSRKTFWKLNDDLQRVMNVEFRQASRRLMIRSRRCIKDVNGRWPRLVRRSGSRLLPGRGGKRPTNCRIKSVMVKLALSESDQTDHQKESLLS